MLSGDLQLGATAAHAALPRSLRDTQKVTPSDAKQHHRTLVVQLLHGDGPLSRAEIARRTGLTKVTISSLVAELIEFGLIRELGPQETQGPGKRAILVDLARDAFLVAALDLSDHEQLHGALLDLDGNVVSRAQTPRSDATGDLSGERICDLVVKLAQALQSQAQAPILGLGVATPGVVDTDGVVHTAPNLGWTNLPLREILEQRTGLPTIVANDANVAALAEYSFGEASDDLLLIRLGYGVGAGLIIGGNAVIGSQFAVGEIGQVMVGTDLGIEAGYSRDQVLEHWLSVPSIERALREAGPEGHEAVLRQAGQRLGVALAPVIGMLNLSEVVLAGPLSLVEGPLAEAALESIRTRTMPVSHTGLVLRASVQGDDLMLLGATASVLKEQLGVG